MNPLKDLSNTYFVVENINHKVVEKGKSDPKEIKEFYEQMELDDKEKLKPIELVIEKTFKKDYYFNTFNLKHFF